MLKVTPRALGPLGQRPMGGEGGGGEPGFTFFFFFCVFFAPLFLGGGDQGSPELRIAIEIPTGISILEGVKGNIYK